MINNILIALLNLKKCEARAVSGISGSRVPNNRLGYPNPNFGSGTRNIALCEELRDDLTKKECKFFSSFKCFSHLKPLKYIFNEMLPDN